uniref:DUF554 domain-containing protein n=1 Tax=Thermofilum pendens TaxID=2269 RepID=A0A7C4BBI9_THEPE
MLGTLVNTVAVLAGSAAGIVLGRRVPERLTSTVTDVIGLFTLYLGFSLALRTEKVLPALFSLLLGAALGTALGVEERLESLAGKLTRGSSRAVEGMMAAFLTFCVGPMTVVGSILDGMGDPSVLLAKSVMDGVVSVAYAASMGAGVALSAPLLLAFQGSLALLGAALGNFLPTPGISALTGVGGVLLLGVGLRLLRLKQVRVGNALPAILLAPILTLAVPWPG